MNTRELNTHTALSPIDGRYRKTGAKIPMSEYDLMHWRLAITGEYVIALSREKHVSLRTFTDREERAIRKMAKLTPKGMKRIKEIEGKANHDVNACVEYLREKFASSPLLNDCVEWVHFASTSEDVNNIAYGIMLTCTVRDVLIPALLEICNWLLDAARAHDTLPMLARTHGQPASPTTWGKECNVFRHRLVRQIQQLVAHRILVKQNGATGNYNAHVVTFPEADWLSFTKYYIFQLCQSVDCELKINYLTTQIESHDSYVELFDILKRINCILIKLAKDYWQYISDKWLTQKVVEGEVGSSAMPHKVNPINFENAWGNLGMANADFEGYARLLSDSRLQRDLSDSTVQRRMGESLGHCLKGYEELLRGLGKVSPNEAVMCSALENSPEVLSEAYQNLLRAAGYSNAYQKVKGFSRGKEITREDCDALIDSLDVPDEFKARMRAVTPLNYIGLAPALAHK